MGDSTKMLGGALLCALLLGILTFGPYILAAMVNYLFGDAFLDLIFGGPIGYWKALVLGILATALFKPQVTFDNGRRR